MEAKKDDPAARAAISALNDLRAATKIGVTFGDYQRRLTDTGVVVERHAAAITEGEIRSAVASSLHYYALASYAFRGRVSGGRGDFDAIGRLRDDAALDDCGHLKPAVEAYVKRSFSESYLREHPVNRREIADAIGHGHTYSLEALWSCGADKIAEAENLLGK